MTLGSVDALGMGDLVRPITFLPPAFEDETLQSLLARQRWLLGCKPHLPIIEAALGPAARDVRTLLPGGIEHLAAAMGDPRPNTTVDLVYRWTAVGYFAPFMSGAAHTRLLFNVHKGWGRGGYSGLGLLRNPWSHRMLNFCTQCRVEDLRIGAMAAWKRTHQLPGVYVCPGHGTSLRASEVPALGSGMLISCPADCSGRELSSPIAPGPTLQVARSSEWLVQHPLSPHPAAVIQATFREIMGQRGLLAVNGSAIPELRGAILEWVGAGDKRGQPRLFGEDSHSMQRLWGRNECSSVPPFAALLLMDFLQVTPSTFFERCSQLARSTIPQAGRKPPQIRSSTVVRHRRSIQCAIAELQPHGRTELRKAVPTQYCFLLKHDRAWLETALPSAKQPRAPVRRWASYDKMMAEQAQAAVTALRSNSGRPKRITFARIAAAMGARTSLYRRDPRLPLTLAVIEAAVECTATLMRRRVMWALGPGRTKATPTWSSFVRAAGLKQPEVGPIVTAWARAAFELATQFPND